MCGNAPPLSQCDLMSSVKSFSSVKFPDVRHNLVEGVTFLIHNFGQKLAIGENGGWRSLIEMLSVVPLSMADTSFQLQVNDGSKDFYSEDSPSSTQYIFPWPIQCLPIAFSAIKIVADEFLDLVRFDEPLITSIISALTNFSAQTNDINVALTAVELLWKVSNATIYAADARSDANRQILLNCLYNLVLDNRPDVRHCALNTLFSALTSHFERLCLPWDRVFNQFVYPLFELFEDRIFSSSL